MNWKRISRKRFGAGLLCAALSVTMISAAVQAKAATYVASVGQSKYTTVAQAVEQAQGQTVTLLANSQEAVSAAGDVYLDLNGYSLAELTVTDGTLYGMDSSTDDYDCANGYGKIQFLRGSYETLNSTGSDSARKRYLAVEDNGSVSFHRIYVGITHSSVIPDRHAVGYKALFAADQVVAERLHETEAFGYQLQLNAYRPVQRWKPAGQFVSQKDVTLRIQNYDSANYGEGSLKAFAQVKLADGTVITSSETVNTLRRMVETVNATYADYSREKLDALATWIRTCDTMMSWQVENILNPPAQTFTVKFINYNGKILETQTVPQGQKVSKHQQH